MLNNPPNSFRLGYRPWLDGLRGAAILLVVAQHLHLLSGGFLGVDLFFVLSGFLITTLLVEERERTGGIRLRRFYFRRALRLLPAFIAVIVVGVVYTQLALPPEQAMAFRKESLIAFLYIANWQKHLGIPMNSLGHTWSLAIEEQFYLVWPLVLCAFFRFRASRRMILYSVVGFIVASCVWRLAFHQYYRAMGTKTWHDMSRLYMGPDTRADSLLTGCLLGLVAVWGLLPTSRKPRMTVAVLAFVAIVLLAMQLPTKHLGHPQYYDGGFTLVALSFGVILVHLLVNPAPVLHWCLECRWLMAIGRVSYGLYLIHVPLFHWMRPNGLLTLSTRDCLELFTAALTLAVLCYYVVEKPFLRLKQREVTASASNAQAQTATSARVKTSWLRWFQAWVWHRPTPR